VITGTSITLYVKGRRGVEERGILLSATKTFLLLVAWDYELTKAFIHFYIHKAGE
jgi:hypothetical protein